MRREIRFNFLRTSRNYTNFVRIYVYSPYSSLYIVQVNWIKYIHIKVINTNGSFNTALMNNRIYTFVSGCSNRRYFSINDTD